MLTGRTDGNKRVVFPDGGVIDGLGRYSPGSSATSTQQEQLQQQTVSFSFFI